METLVTLARRRQRTLREEMAQIDEFIRTAEEIARGAGGSFAPEIRVLQPAPAGSAGAALSAPAAAPRAITALEPAHPALASGDGETRMPRKIIRRTAADGG